MTDPEDMDGPVDIIGLESPKPLGGIALAIQAAVQAAKVPTAGEPLKVRIVAPYRLCQQGTPYVGGNEVTVPGSTAFHWLKHNWAELVPARSKTASQKVEK